MAIQQDLLASTLRVLAKKEIDSTYRAIPLWDAVKTAGNLELVDGGQRVDHALTLIDGSAVTQLSSGYESISLATRDVMRNASFEWCDFAAPIVVSKKEALSNKGPRAILKVAEVRLKQAMGMMRREAHKQILVGNSAILSELQTLNGGASTTGWLEPKTYGTQTNTVGGVSKSGFPESWQNQFADADASGAGGLTIDIMQQMLIDCASYTYEGSVDIIMASPQGYGAYRSLLQDQERYTSIKEMTDLAGRMALMFGGAPMYIAQQLSGATTTDGVATWPLSFYFLNSKSFSLYSDKDAYFEIGEMAQVPGYAVNAATIFARLQMVCANLNGQGILVDGNSV